MKNNPIINKFSWAYLVGFFTILALPILTLQPWFYPPDWGKTIIFRSIISILLFLFIYQLLYKKNQLLLPNLKNIAKTNTIFWTLAGLLTVYFLASIFSVDHLFSFWGSPYRSGGFINFAFYFIFTLLMFLIVIKKDWQKFWDFSIGIGIFVCLIGLIQFYGLFNKIFISAGAGIGSTIGNPIFLGIYLLLLFFITLSFIINECYSSNKYKKWFYVFALLVFLYTILLAGSRATYLGIIIGTSIFLLLYPKKLKIIKISLGLFLLTVTLIVFYVNIISNISKVSQFEYTKFQALESRLLVKKVFSDERYKAWITAIKVIKDKPILGYGPENLAVGFDKNYDPNITWSPWWDKAHNVFLDIGTQTGILGILSYISLFIALFWELKKEKSRTDDNNKKIIITGIQAMLAGYLTANFFSFDSMPTYLLFFFVISYCIYLTTNNASIESQKYTEQKSKWHKSLFTFVLFLLLIIFLWQYNLVPLQLNTHLSNVDILVNMNKCDDSIAVAEKYLNQRSILDSYYRMTYVNDMSEAGEIDQDELTVIHASTNEIDIAEDIKEYIVLAVPMKLLCKDDCAGLCVTCGTNLNHGTCTCPRDESDPRWEKLKNFTNKN